jgi:hypothetical protein
MIAEKEALLVAYFAWNEVSAKCHFMCGVKVQPLLMDLQDPLLWIIEDIKGNTLTSHKLYVNMLLLGKYCMLEALSVLSGHSMSLDMHIILNF